MAGVSPEGPDTTALSSMAGHTAPVAVYPALSGTCLQRRLLGPTHTHAHHPEHARRALNAAPRLCAHLDSHRALIQHPGCPSRPSHPRIRAWWPCASADSHYNQRAIAQGLAARGPWAGSARARNASVGSASVGSARAASGELEGGAPGSAARGPGAQGMGLRGPGQQGRERSARHAATRSAHEWLFNHSAVVLSAPVLPALSLPALELGVSVPLPRWMYVDEAGVDQHVGETEVELAGLGHQPHHCLQSTAAI